MNKLKTLWSYMRTAAPYRGIPQQLIDLILHKIVINFSAADYYRFEFYKKGKSWEEKSRYVALGGSRYWPFANNELKYSITLTDKYIQKHLLVGLGLPTPRLITTLGKGREIQGEQQFYAFIEGLNQEIVLKPVSSAGGSDVWVLYQKAGRLFSADAPCIREDLWAKLHKHLDRGLLIEEKLSNIGVLARLNPNCFNTFRVVTIKTSDGRWHCPAASVKIGAAGAVVDNNAEGGIQINLDVQGRPYCAYDFGLRELITHDKSTGMNLLDLEFEGYADVVALALRASRKLNFLGTIGWDIGYTERGPMIIEGNIIWGCSSLQRGRPGVITDELAHGLDRHFMFGRWDKSRLHPGYWKKGLLRRLIS
jgi:Sugar-transfer associated ATP-grasp